jgi:toxin YoeB
VNIELSDQAKEDIAHWNRVDPSRTAKIQRLLQSVMQTPYSGLGKPEPLKHSLSGYWSRRIDMEHRLVYRIAGETLYVVSCRYHYR